MIKTADYLIDLGPEGGDGGGTLVACGTPEQVAEQNADPQYSREMFIGIEDADGAWLQDLAIVRSSYRYDGDKVVWNDEQFDVMVFGEEDEEDFTEEFNIQLRHESN